MQHKILHIIDSLGHGGTERQLVLNVGGLNSTRFQSYVCHVHSPDDLMASLSAQGVPVFDLDINGRPQWLKGVMRLRKMVKDLDIDLIHTNLFEADVIGGLTGRLTGRPVVSTIANVCFAPEFLIDNPNLTKFKMAGAKNVRSFIARSCNSHLIPVSQTVANSTVKQLRVPPEKTSIIRRGLSPHWLEISPENVVQRLSLELGLADSWPILINVGRLIPQKGQRYLIEAMPEVKRRFPKARLLLAGDGYLKPSLLNLRDQLGLADTITFLGRRNDVKDLLNLSHIFVFPSLFEGCPNALIEAMATGKPCVASRIDSIAEVVGDGVNGLLVPPQNPEALANSIIHLSTHQDEALSMGNRSRKMALEQYTIRAAVEKLEEVYEKVLHAYHSRGNQPSSIGSGQKISRDS